MLRPLCERDAQALQLSAEVRGTGLEGGLSRGLHAAEQPRFCWFEVSLGGLPPLHSSFSPVQLTPSSSFMLLTRLSVTLLECDKMVKLGCFNIVCARMG